MSSRSDVRPRFFASSAELRAWLEANPAATELWVGFWKAHTGRAGLSYEAALDEALCFGWIDGLVRRVDEAAYMQRFTPRRAKSIWSAVNTRRVKKLESAGRMAAAGLAAFAARDPARTGVYSFERSQIRFDPAMERRLRAHKAAWRFFEAQPPGYRRLATFWITSAKREETRERRFAKLLEDSAAGRRVAAVTGEKSPAASVSGRAGRSRR